MTMRLDTERFVEYLREHHMASNVDIAEVQAVDLTDLKGVDDVLEALEANVIMPLENADVSQELGLQPKRGVLLAGPPGTGKTTIGRALARRLKSKFFLHRRHGHQRHARLLPARPPHLRGREAERAVHHLHRRQRRHLRERQRHGPVSLPADDARRPGERERGAHLPHDDGDGRRQPAAGAGPLGPHRAVAGDAAARRAGARGHPARSLRAAAGGARRRRRRRDSPRRAKASPAPTSSASSRTASSCSPSIARRKGETQPVDDVLPARGGNGAPEQAAVRRGRGACPSAPPPAPGLLRPDERVRGHGHERRGFGGLWARTHSSDSTRSGARGLRYRGERIGGIVSRRSSHVRDPTAG